MSREECPPGAIIIVFINCIVDGERAARQVGCDECLCDRKSPHVSFLPGIQTVCEEYLVEILPGVCSSESNLNCLIP